ncbi:MAG: tape measure protein [Fermentimonas sp.]|nr:tape measure protein [Fermentimonas sp.]
MSRTIDSRVVEMRFDNKEFERNVSTSMSTLDKLKQSLNLTGASKGLENVAAAANNVNMSSLSGAIENVRFKFSALEVMAVTALANITNSAINAGKRIAGAMFGSIFEGGKTRALNIEQAKFQFEGLGMDIEKTMADASYAVDGTAYSLDAAAKVASQLGASGMRAGDDMRKSLRAVSGVAAMAGSSYEDIGNVFTKVAGQGRLMGDDLLRLSSRGINAAATIAKELNITEAEVRDMVTKGKVDFQMFADAMDSAFGEHATAANKTFTGAMSNVKSALARIGEKFYTPFHANLIAPLNALRVLINEINKAIDPAFESLSRFMKVASDKAVKALEGLDFSNLTNTFKGFTDGIKMGNEDVKNISKTFAGFFALLDIGRMAITAIVSGILDLIKALFPVTGNFLSLTGGIGDFIVAIRDALKSSDTFGVAIQNIGKVLKPVAEGIVMFTDLIASAFKAVRAPDMTGIDEFTRQIEERFQPLIKLGEALKNFFGFFYNLATAIGKIFSGLSASILNSLNGANFNAIFDFINSGLFAAILYGIKKFIDSLTRITDSAGGFLSGITGIFDGVRGCLAAYQSQLKAGVLLKIAISIGILAAALLTISMIDSEKLTTSLAAMTAMFIELFGAMAVFGTLTGVKGFLAMTSLTTGMIGLSIAVLILAGAMKKLSSLDWAGVVKGLLAIAGLTGILVGATKLLEASSKSLILTSVGFVIFGASILVLTQAVKQLGSIDTGDLLKGLLGVGALLVGLAVFMRTTDLSGMGIIRSIGVLILAGAITVLASAVKKLSSINIGDMIKGLGGLAVMLTTILVFLKFSGNAKHVIATAISLTILGAAMNIFAAAIIKMGAMSWEQMARGLVALGGALAIITVALIAMPKNIFLISIALLDIAGAMMMLTVALNSFASMPWEELGRGLLGLAASLVLVVGAFVALARTGSIVDSSAFVILALGITLLAAALKTIGSMSLVQIGAALLGLAGTFAILGVATTLLTPAIPAILAFSAAIALLGIGVVAIGAGILTLSTGLAALAVAGTAGTVALVALVTSLIGLIPFAAKTLAEGVIEFANIIGKGVPIIANAIKAIVIAIVDVLVELTPVVVDGILTLLTKLLESLLKYMPNILDVGGKLVVEFLKGIASNIQNVVEAGIDLIINFIKGVNAKLGDIIQAGFDLMVAFINGLATSVEKNGGAVLDAVLNLILSIITLALKTLSDSISMFFNIGEDIVIGLLEGIKNKISDVVSGVTHLATSAIEAARAALRSSSPSIEFKDIGLDIGEGLAIGIDNSSPKVEASSEKMTKKAVTAAEKAAAKTAKEAEKAAKDAFNASADWIDERKYYNELSLYEELDAWERVQKRYLEGTEERKKADIEVYRVKQEIARADEEFSQQIIDVTRKATDKKIEYEQEYYDKCKEINDKLISDIQSLNDKYDNALESRTKSVYDTYGLFDKIEPKDKVLGSDLINNLKDQVNEFDDWTRQMSDLSGRGVDSALIDELQKMGPKSLKEIQALNSLSQPELDEYVILWEKKSNQAKNAATKELEGMRIETRNQIQALNVQAKIDLEEQRAIFEEKTQQLAKETTETIEQMKNEWLKKIGELRKQGEKDFETFAGNIVSIMGKPDWAGVGRGIVDGITTGIRSEASQLADSAVDAAMNALQAAKDALGISSPSKKFAELGKYSILGFVEGLKKFNNLATASASNVGTSTIIAFKKVIANISDAIDGDMDMSPVIRPVLDLTDVKSGSLLIDELFAQTQGLNVGNVMKKLPIFYNAEDSDGINTKSSKETKVSFVQNNYSPKALSRLEIYRQTKNQISTLRGVVGTT